MRRSHLRLGLRLARRELRRRPWRTALVLLMVLIPSMAMTAVTIFIRTGEWDAADRLRAEVGRADAAAYPTTVEVPASPDTEALLAAFPPGTRIEVRAGVWDRVSTPDDRTYFNVSDTRLDDRMNDGRFGPVRGRLPRTGGEVVVTTELAERLDVGVGDRIRLDRLDRQVEVVGTVRPNSSDVAAYVGAPLAKDERNGTEILFDVPDALDAERVIETAHVPGWQIASTSSGSDGGSNVFWVYLGGGVGLIVLGTVITAAFAVGARRQLRSIGLLSASGAAPRTVRWFLVAQGALAGAIGSIAGAGLAILAWQVVPDSYVEDVAGRPVAGPVVRLTDLVPVIAIGVVVAAAACWIPARSAAKVPTLQALAGRRPLPKVPRRLPVLGATGVAGGCALLAMAVAGARQQGSSGSSSLWALVAVAGGLAVVLGAIAVAPWVVAQLEWLGRGLRPGGRMASRSLARNRVRSSAVIGAICSVAIVVVAGSTLYVSSRAPGTSSELPYIRTNQVLLESSRPDAGESVARPAPEVERRIRRDVPGAVLIPLRTPKLPRPTVPGMPSHGADVSLVPQPDAPWTNFRGVVVASEDLLDHFEVPADLRAALDRGEAVAVTRVPADVTKAFIHRPLAEPVQGNPTTPELVFGGSFESPNASEATNYLLVGPAGIARAGLGTERSPNTLIVLPEDTSAVARDRLQLLNDDLNWDIDRTGGADGFVQLYVGGEPPPLTDAQVKWLLFALAALVVLAVVAVGLALAAQDEAEERQVLAAVGAPPRLVQRATALKAALLVLVAGALAVPAGLLPAATILAATDSESRGGDWAFRVDVPSLLLVLVIVPVLAGLVTWFGGRMRTWLRPKRPDVFAFGD